MNKAEILNEIHTSLSRMSPEQRRLWELIRIDPSKWRQSPYGTPTKGFWVVAIFGSQVIWYNEIEEGFNRSSYVKFGIIDQYWCNQDNLEWTMQRILVESDLID